MRLRLVGSMMLVALLGASSAPALAQSDGPCTGVGGEDMTAAIGAAQVAKGKAKLNFVQGSDDGAACPSAAAACQARAYLVPGDVVLTLPGEHKGHVCASFAGRTGRETSGWLPANGLVALPTPKIEDKDWLGAWVRTEARITIKRGKDGKLAIEGAATYGAGDSRRVASGAVNTGEFSGLARRMGEIVLVADGDVASFEAAKDECAVRLRRAGPYLLVEDNRMCGGLNVSFTGLYAKAAATR